MSTKLITPRRILSVGLAAGLSAALVVSALAAHPKAGKPYAGFTSGNAFNGFKPPVSFKVSSNGKQLLRFKYFSRRLRRDGRTRRPVEKSRIREKGRDHQRRQQGQLLGQERQIEGRPPGFQSTHDQVQLHHDHRQFQDREERPVVCV